MNDLKFERIKLEEIKKKYNEIICDLKLNIKSLYDNRNINNDELTSLIYKLENRIRIIYDNLNKPYFARIDFQESHSTIKETYYIGKVGLHDYDNNLITIDWRAPVASLYYDSNIGNTSYVAPEGIINGNLSLKRQYNIEEGEIKSYNDVDIVSNDEILKPYLNVNSDNRLKNIVSSIQKEQNKIIRNKLEENIIIQGVAGSGKTTVALHRIAYLAYNNKDVINSNQYMVIGPNKSFINYISSVLPDLDVTDVSQLTFEEFTKQYLNENFNIVKSINNNYHINKFKMSISYKKIIDEYVDIIDQNIVVPQNDLIINGFNILSQERIKEIYFNIDNTNLESINDRIDKCVLTISTYLKNNAENIILKINSQYDKKISLSNNEPEKKKTIEAYNKLKKEISSTGCFSNIKKYFTFKNKKIYLLYIEMIKNIEKYSKNEYISDIKNQQKQLKNNLTFEDLAALIYLNYKIHGSKKYKNIMQTVIDEAQDYGTFNFYALKLVLKNSSFSIFGDLAQSIYDYRSIDNWNDVINQCFNNNCKLEYLIKSYRTTVEIMDEANLILKHIGLKTSIPVIRHGENVHYKKIENNYYENLSLIVKKLSNKNYKSIALISRTDEEVEEVFYNLRKIGIDIERITENNCFNNKICTLSSEVSKGLEFDAVIITDASESKYSKDNTTDMKNLYVSMTRPLHELYIIYKDTLTFPLSQNTFLI